MGFIKVLLGKENSEDYCRNLIEKNNQITIEHEKFNEKMNEIANDLKNKAEIQRKNEKTIKCSECGAIQPHENNYCTKCNHKLKKISEYSKAYRIYCPTCGDRISKDDKYCGKEGHEIKIKHEKRCPICGEWTNEDGDYCYNCGHDFNKYLHLNHLAPKICPHCGSKFEEHINYCSDCGTKLEKKNRLL